MFKLLSSPIMFQIVCIIIVMMIVIYSYYITIRIVNNINKRDTRIKQKNKEGDYVYGVMLFSEYSDKATVSAEYYKKYILTHEMYSSGSIYDAVRMAIFYDYNSAARAADACEKEFNLQFTVVRINK